MLQRFATILAFYLITAQASSQVTPEKVPPTGLYLMSSAELLSLDEADQREYLKAVRNILGEASIQSDVFSHSLSPHLFRYLLPEAHAQTGPEKDPDRLVADGVPTAYEDFKKFETEVAKYSGTISDEDAAHARRALSILIGDVQTGLNLDRPEMVKKAKEAFNDIYSQLEKKYWSRLTPFMVKTLSARQSIINKVQRSDRKDDATTAHQRRRANKGPAVAVDPTAPPSGCLYGGFVFKTSPCRGVTELPETYKSLSPFSSAQFKCEKNEIICNPILFGFETDCPEDSWFTNCPTLKPVCTFRSARATAICRNKAVDSKYYDRALALIAKAPKIWDQFNLDLKEVCQAALTGIDANTLDKKRASLGDVARTCLETRERLAAIHHRANAKANAVETPAPKEAK